MSEFIWPDLDNEFGLSRPDLELLWDAMGERAISKQFPEASVDAQVEVGMRQELLRVEVARYQGKGDRLAPRIPGSAIAFLVTLVLINLAPLPEEDIAAYVLMAAVLTIVVTWRTATALERARDEVRGALKRLRKAMERARSSQTDQWEYQS